MGSFRKSKGSLPARSYLYLLTHCKLNAQEYHIPPRMNHPLIPTLENTNISIESLRTTKIVPKDYTNFVPLPLPLL